MYASSVKDSVPPEVMVMAPIQFACIVYVPDNVWAVPENLLVLFVNVIDCEAVATPCAVAVKVNVEVETANVGTRLSDAMKASEEPFRVVCAAVDGKTGRSAENVWPVTNTVGTVPRAMPKIWSGLPPACPDPPK